jgi:hypothetical protein
MEYRRNWDKLYYNTPYLKQHWIKDETVYPVTEPVTVAELKNYLHLDGFAGVDGVEDALLADIISDARARLEAASDTNLVPHIYKVSFSSYNSYYTLPYTLDSITAFTDWSDVAYTDYTLENGTILSTGDFYVTYTTLPIDTTTTKMSVLRLAAFMYQQRGDTDESILSQKANDLSAHYSQRQWLL